MILPAGPGVEARCAPRLPIDIQSQSHHRAVDTTGWHPRAPDDVEVAVTVAEPGAGPARAVALHDASLAHDLRSLRSNVAEVLRSRPESVLVDVSDLTRPSSSVVAALLWAKRSCARGGVGFTVRGVGNRNGEVLRRCGLFIAPLEDER